MPLGTSLSEVLEFAGGLKEPAEKLISGGPMMGHPIHNLDAPVMKGSSSILCLTAREAQSYEEENCMRCGRCAQACPELLMPMLMDGAALKKDNRKYIRLYGLECVTCGCCSYVCPARRRLTERFVDMKVSARAYQKEHERRDSANGA
ncbi:Electron transport complex subunit RnfC [bioreactor metagenome]|uniref:Electron transport complex subunit RnfC n=1 Tax=bioreactor metagenome TaxID=1076179 RepID=A0A645CNL9_9ZZZZ